MTNMTDKKDVLMVSRPVAPPWHDSSKNLTKHIISYIDSVNFHVLTPKGYHFNKENVISEDIYQPTGDYAAELQQNLQALFHLITSSNKIDLFHYFHTPKLHKSLVLKHLTKLKKRPCVQTVTSTPKDFKDINSLFFADKTVTLSDYGKQKLEENGLTNVIRIYPGIDLKEIDDFNPYDLKFREENDLLENFLIMFAGDYEDTGANKTILESIPPIISKYPTVKFIFACHNRSEEAKAIEAELKQYAINLGIEKFVMFLGSVENMLEVIRSIDICLYPVKSLYNKMDIPFVLLECMAYAKPVIITNIGPLKELVKGDIGFTIEPDDINSLTQYTLELLQSNNLRMVKGFNGRKVVQTHFNMKILSVEYEKLYHNLLNEPL